MNNGEEVNGIRQNMSEPELGTIMPQELNEETKASRRKVSAFYKGTIVAIAVLGLFLILLGYSIGSELVNTASHCPDNRPCLLISPDFGGFVLALSGGYLMLLSLILWLLRDRVSPTAYGPLGPPMNRACALDHVASNRLIELL